MLILQSVLGVNVFCFNLVLAKLSNSDTVIASKRDLNWIHT